MVATVPTACGIETCGIENAEGTVFRSCNSTYRLRYWNLIAYTISLTISLRVATVPTACGIETQIF